MNPSFDFEPTTAVIHLLSPSSRFSYRTPSVSLSESLNEEDRTDSFDVDAEVPSSNLTPLSLRANSLCGLPEIHACAQSSRSSGVFSALIGNCVLNVSTRSSPP